MHKFISANKHWHGLLSSLDNLRIISMCLAPDLWHKKIGGKYVFHRFCRHLYNVIWMEHRWTLINTVVIIAYTHVNILHFEVLSIYTTLYHFTCNYIAE